ncbi:MAG: Na+/H+ antiporter [Anaerolineaceae bacterium]|nr:Na+/H+ antiporter [Anaerolineaceae bacterium]
MQEKKSILHKFLICVLMFITLTACIPQSSSTILPTESLEIGEITEEELEEEESTEHFLKLEGLIITLLLFATIIIIISEKIRIPYTVGLVIGGLIMTTITNLPPINLSPDLFLALLIPPLVFEAAYHIDFKKFRYDIALISTMAVPGVILTTGLVGIILYWNANLPWTYALIFGSLIAATDPISVIAIFRSMGVPNRLQLLLEGESLLNDGTAIVMFNLMVAIALTGEFSLTESLKDFVVVAGGGLFVGASLGLLTSRFISRLNNRLIETVLSFTLAYGAYLLAEEALGLSGVLAVVAAGIALGNYAPRSMAPTTRLLIVNFWELAAFIANAFVFLYIGLKVEVSLLVDNIVPILWAILAVLVARFISTFGISFIGRGVPKKWKPVIFWGGLRGAISLALVLSLPESLPYREQLQAMAFGVVLFSILIEGSTMGTIINRLGIAKINPIHAQYKLKQAQAIALQAAQNRLQKMNKEGLLSDPTWEIIKPSFNKRIANLADAIGEMLIKDTSLQDEELVTACREALNVQRTTYSQLMRENLITEESYNQLVAQIDAGIENPDAVIKSFDINAET